jgi:hypothetical protein
MKTFGNPIDLTVRSEPAGSVTRTERDLHSGSAWRGYSRALTQSSNDGSADRHFDSRAWKKSAPLSANLDNAAG